MADICNSYIILIVFGLLVAIINSILLSQYMKLKPSVELTEESIKNSKILCSVLISLGALSILYGYYKGFSSKSGICGIKLREKDSNPFLQASFEPESLYFYEL